MTSLVSITIRLNSNHSWHLRGKKITTTWPSKHSSTLIPIPIQDCSLTAVGVRVDCRGFKSLLAFWAPSLTYPGCPWPLSHIPTSGVSAGVTAAALKLRQRAELQLSNLLTVPCAVSTVCCWNTQRMQSLLIWIHIKPEHYFPRTAFPYTFRENHSVQLTKKFINPINLLGWRVSSPNHKTHTTSETSVASFNGMGFYLCFSKHWKDYISRF